MIPRSTSPSGVAVSPAGAALWAPRLDRESAVPLSRQLAAALRRTIAEGSFGAGARLPSTRSLATALGIARSTVVAVFEQLAAEGYIVAKPGSGYYVPAPLGQQVTDPVERNPVAGSRRALSRRATSLSDWEAPLARAVPRPFEPGHAEIDARFIATWKHLASRALSGRSRLVWGYGDPQGEPELRQAIAEYLAAARAVRCRPEQIVLTSGTQQGLSLVAQLLLDPGDAAIVEDPCYRSTVDILRAADAFVVPVPVDDDGLTISAGTQSGGVRPRVVYTTPSRQYPLGMAMPLARRAALLAWAERTGTWIVEDDYESEFQHPARTLPSLQGLDRGGRVIYLGTFSKLLFPSLRLGYAVLPDDLVRPFAALRHLADRQSSGLLQRIMTDFILEGHFARHLKRMRVVYAGRQEFLTDQLTRRLDGLLRVRPNECGMYLTAFLPSGWSDSSITQKLAAAEVVTVPLSSLVLTTERPPGLVLGYSGHSEVAIARAVERVAGVLDCQTGMDEFKKPELLSDQLRA